MSPCGVAAQVQPLASGGQASRQSSVLWQALGRGGGGGGAHTPWLHLPGGAPGGTGQSASAAQLGAQILSPRGVVAQVQPLDPGGHAPLQSWSD